MTLDFWQIFYKDEQLPQLYDFATPYKNETLSLYFENSVIAELVPKATADLVGVASWRLKQKRNESSTEFILRRQNGHTLLTKEAILSAEFDVAVLTPRNNSHQPLSVAAHWHGQAWIDAFPVFARYLRNEQNLRVPDDVKTTIYENHFIARREIYQEYVETCLKPAMKHMENESVYFANADYAKRKPQQERLEYQAKTGREDWPIAPFILERLFSIWIDRRNFKVIAV